MRYLLPALAAALTIAALAIGTVVGDDAVPSDQVGMEASSPGEGHPTRAAQPTTLQFTAALGGLAALLIVAPMTSRR